MMGISGSYGLGLQQAMLSANSAMMQAKVQSGARGKLDGRADVLKAEIKQDGTAGLTSQSKQEELNRVQKASEETMRSQAGTLEKANQALQEAAEAEKKENDAAASRAEKEKAVSSSGISEEKGEKGWTAGSRLYTSEGRLSAEKETESLSLQA